MAAMGGFVPSPFESIRPLPPIPPFGGQGLVGKSLDVDATHDRTRLEVYCSTHLGVVPVGQWNATRAFVNPLADVPRQHCECICASLFRRASSCGSFLVVVVFG